MSGVTVLEVAVILALALLNGVLAMSETAMVSSRAARLRGRAEAGDGGARVALELAAEPNRFLSTVQIGITLVGVFAGALGGATLAGTLSSALERVPFLAPYAPTLALGVVVVGIAYVSLVLGELVPKRLALAAPEKVASLVSRPMRRLSTLAAPAVWFLGASTDAVLRALRVGPATEPPITEREIEILLEEGARAGALEALEGEIAGRALGLDDRPVREVMTPLPNVVWLDAEDPPEEHWRVVAESRHSYFPVGRGSLDNLLGVASVKGAIARSAREGGLAGIVSEVEGPPLVSEGAPASGLLEVFARPGPRVALVLDERGNLEGLVTPTDVLTALVGEIPRGGAPGGGPARPAILEREDGSWLVDGSLPVTELQKLLGLASLPRDGEGYQTLGGMVLAALGKVPEGGERFVWEDHAFEVLDMDGYRVDKVLVNPPRRPARAPTGGA